MAFLGCPRSFVSQALKAATRLSEDQGYEAAPTLMAHLREATGLPARVTNDQSLRAPEAMTRMLRASTDMQPRAAQTLARDRSAARHVLIVRRTVDSPLPGAPPARRDGRPACRMVCARSPALTGGTGRSAE